MQRAAVAGPGYDAPSPPQGTKLSPLFVVISLPVSKKQDANSFFGEVWGVFSQPFEHDGRELFFFTLLRRRSADKGSWRAGARQGHFLPINDHICAKVARRIARHSMAVLTAQDVDQLQTAIE